MTHPPLERVEGNLRLLRQRFPDADLPVQDILILRACVMLGRDVGALFDRLLPSGLSESEFRLMLSLLAQGGSATAGDVCASLAQSAANLTRVADSLVQRRFITRGQDESDRRRVVLTLLPEGEKLLGGLLPGVGREVSAVLASFEPEEKQRLLEFLRRLLEATARVGHEPAGDAVSA